MRLQIYIFPVQTSCHDRPTMTVLYVPSGDHAASRAPISWLAYRLNFKIYLQISVERL